MARILLAVALVASWGTGVAAAADRAIWIWEKDSSAMLADVALAEDAVAFLRSKQIRTVYVHVDAFKDRNLLEGQPELYRQLVGRLHRGGLQVFALLGSANVDLGEYVLPGQRPAALAMFQRVLTYNAGAGPDQRFDGVNIDIEPHTLVEWRGQKEQLLLQFLDLGQSFMQMKRASGQALLVGPAIPFWLDGITLRWNGAERPVSEHVIDTYDYIALMDYRNRAAGRDGLVAHARDEVAYAARTHGKVVIGVEVTPNELPKVSFNHLAEPDLERELALTARAFQNRQAFAGFAIHHYRSYRAWLGTDRRPD